MASDAPHLQPVDEREPVRDWVGLGVEAQADALAEGRVTSLELTRAALARARPLQPILRPFRVIFERESLADAAEADRRLAGGVRAALLGVPVAIKDDVDYAGHTTPSAAFEGLACYGQLTRSATDAALVLVGAKPVVDLSRRAESALRRRVARTFDTADVVLTPTTAQLAPLAGAFEGRGWWATSQAATAHCPYAFAWIVLGWPAISVPAGLSESGLPMGAQLLGPQCSEGGPARARPPTTGRDQHRPAQSRGPGALRRRLLGARP